LRGVPAALERAVARCLEKPPDSRFQSARDLAFTLAEIAATGVGEATPLDSIAVLPFSTATATPDAEYLSDGITESVINGLAQVPQLRVVARSTVFRHRGNDPLDVGRTLGVRTVVTGRVFHRGEDLLISAELTDIERGSQIWGEQYRRRLADIFDIQEEISREISRKLRVKLTGEEVRRLTKRHTGDEEAYRAYLKGRHCWNQRTADGIRQAVEHFRMAIDTDPTYALAYCGLGDALAMRGIYQHLAPRDAFPKAIAAARRALEMDVELAEAHATLGFVALYHGWNLREAERELHTAIDLNPAHPSAHQWYAMVLGLNGRCDDAIKESELAQRHDPFAASINTTAAWPLYWARRTEEAVSRLREAIGLHPHYWSAHYFFGLCLQQKGDLAAAIDSLERAHALSDSSWSLEGLGHAYARAGRMADARRALAELEQLSVRQYIPPYSYAVIHAGLGNVEAALTALAAAIEDRSWRIAWLPVDPMLDAVRNDARFQTLLARAAEPQLPI
jgi:TolB-like protein/Flp pilus assembly protein TadD